MEVRLPWPSAKSGLSQNSSHANPFAKGRAVKKGRDMGWKLALAARAHLISWPAEGPIAVHFRFEWPKGPRPDETNAIGATKAMMDGVADAMKVDDKRFTITHEMVGWSPKPGVTVIIQAPE